MQAKNLYIGVWVEDWAAKMRWVGVLCGCALVVSGAVADAQSRTSTKSRAQLFEHQTDVLDNRAARQYANSVRLQPDSLFIPGLGDGFGERKPYSGPYLEMARKAARRNRVPEDLFLRLVAQESAWNPNAVSHKGAIGLAQLMPTTARALRVDPRDPEQNLDGGARYLRQQYETFRSWRLALAAYNAGPGAVEKHNGVPPYRETQNYVKIILGRS